MLLTDLIRTIIFFIVTINPFSQCDIKVQPILFKEKKFEIETCSFRAFNY